MVGAVAPSPTSVCSSLQRVFFTILAHVPIFNFFKIGNYYANVILHARSKKTLIVGTRNGASAHLCPQTDAPLVVPTQRIAFLRADPVKN